MTFRKKLLILLLQLIIAVLLAYIAPGHASFLSIYDTYIFYPFQSLRGILFHWLPFSVGDVVYVAGGAWLLWILIKWVRYIIRFQTFKRELGTSIINTINAAIFIYLFFMLGWGINYDRLPLRESWNFDTKFSFRKDSAALIAFDRSLIDSLNAIAPVYRSLSLKEINSISKENYRTYTDSKVSAYGIGIKPTLFGFALDRLSIEGYYNPFTGEGQLDKDLPAFMLPFVVTHEMAHQAGIAAEGDANLMAYSLGTICNNRSFNYSAYLNIWLYVNARLYHKDSTLAQSLSSKLNKLTMAHIDTIEQLNREGNNDASKYGSYMYDSYLKMQHQKEGIHSYGSVAVNAYLLEQRRKMVREKVIHIP